jgi:hypothetical protein
MSGLTKRHALGVFLFCLGLLIVVAWALGWIPTYAEYCEQNPQTKHEECATYNIGLIAVWQIGKFLDAIAVPLTALATAAIGYFTYTLKASTDRLWIAGEKQRTLSEDTAKRQLRAYVHVADPIILHANSERPTNVRIQFKNYGQTPAYRVSNRFKCGLQLMGEPGFTIPEKIVIYSDLGPTQDSVTILVIAQNDWEFMMANVMHNNGTVHVSGEITYFDVFEHGSSGQPHHTWYRFQIHIADGAPYVLFTDDGNISD